MTQIGKCIECPVLQSASHNIELSKIKSEKGIVRRARMKNPLWKHPGLDRLIVVTVCSVVLFLIQIVMSHVTHSLTLLAAAYHMLYNIFSLMGCIATIKVWKNQFDRVCTDHSNLHTCCCQTGSDFLSFSIWYESQRETLHSFLCQQNTMKQAKNSAANSRCSFHARIIHEID